MGDNRTGSAKLIPTAGQLSRTHCYPIYYAFPSVRGIASLPSSLSESTGTRSGRSSSGRSSSWTCAVTVLTRTETIALQGRRMGVRCMIECKSCKGVHLAARTLSCSYIRIIVIPSVTTVRRYAEFSLLVASGSAASIWSGLYNIAIASGNRRGAGMTRRSL